MLLGVALQLSSKATDDLRRLNPYLANDVMGELQHATTGLLLRSCALLLLRSCALPLRC